MNKPLEACPKCGGNDLLNDEMFFEGGTLDIHLICGECSYTWYEVWKFEETMLDIPLTD